MHHRNHHDAMSIFVEKGGVNRRVFGASGCVPKSYSLKYFLNFCYKFLQAHNFFMHTKDGAGDRAAGLMLRCPLENIDHLSESLATLVIAPICHLPILSLWAIVMFVPSQRNRPTVRPFATLGI